MRKCGCPARPRSTSRAVGCSTDFARSGDPGSTRTSAHTRGHILLATPRIGPSATTVVGKNTRTTMFPFAPHSPRWGNVSEASMSRLLPIGYVSHYMARPNAPGASPFVRDLTPIWYSSAYSPRSMMSSMHASPADAVRIFRDVRAKKALAMHWG